MGSGCLIFKERKERFKGVGDGVMGRSGLCWGFDERKYAFKECNISRKRNFLGSKIK